MRVLHAQSSVPPVQTRQCQVVTGGEMQVRVSEPMSLLRAPTESESNALLRSLFGSHFIYSSLLHTIPNSERGSLFFNEQCCYIELLTPTENGFRLVFCSLNPAEVTAGKAPPERVTSLHPVSGWLIAQSSQTNPETLQFTFQAAFTGNLPDGCDFQVAQNRLLFLAKRVRRLEKVIRRRHRHHRQRATLEGRLWHILRSPFQAAGVSGDGNEGGKRHNWHCIACTRSFLPALSKRWRRSRCRVQPLCSNITCLHALSRMYRRTRQ
ncbi:uncharacterized protein PITG_15285 [Phytophthora infestans T30-4]|uniref:Uncharacterized protein n=1 Tax=Phytophthora infestans (strain T30-4) TaxID=403677 RepID=D0NQC1_PHYIT|nr:uncharacterized protein PITG_15285 [Phytophthora infestans T30-4]EEY62853.1 conserved hypothetical protein [Phytophthora infestans T30-4]|eukprot:XP_002898728.1 conserved hypothetical protein [Phytophthora infestans T30-4]